jgi:diadenosine tetraphosphate (Ap4A) HIT family hydrolase
MINTMAEVSDHIRCLSCAVVHGMKQPPGGAIIETEFFHAHQDVAYPIPGLVIVASKRHILCLDELTSREAADYISLLQRIRKAQRDVLGIEHVYYFYNEDTTHHFHIWMVPRHEWMSAFGRSVESVRPVLRHAREMMAGKENIAAVIESVRRLREALCG